jgi:hypothetical protein
VTSPQSRSAAAAWQVERSKLEEYIKRMYELAANNLEKLPVEGYEPFG